MGILRMSLLVFCVLMLCSFRAQGGEREKHFEDAFRYFSRGIEAEGEERETLINTAAVLYEKIIRESGISNGYLYYNLGNCYLMLEEIGKAILSYRRAERLIPGYGNLRENLQTAISRRIDKEERGQLKKIVKTLSLQSYWFSYSTTLILFTTFFSLIWAILALQLFFKSPVLKVLLVLSICIAFLFGLAGGIYLYSDYADVAGVILAKTCEARKGPGIRYEPSFTSSLHEGTEFSLLERHSGWLHIRLESGEDCWIPEEDAELVRRIEEIGKREDE